MRIKALFVLAALLLPTSLQAQTRSYPNSSTGLEAQIEGMFALAQAGKNQELRPMLESMELPDADTWFTERFGNSRCGDAQMDANDCMGPRLALAYQYIAKNLTDSLELTFKDLSAEGFTSFEAVNYAERCALPIRITPSVRLSGDLSTTPFLAVLPGKGEPLYVVWIYGGDKQTTLAFFVYYRGAFRYLGMPHPASLEEYARKQVNLSLSPRVLTDDQVHAANSAIDANMVQRTAVVEVKLDGQGKAANVSYVRGPAQYKEQVIATVRKRKFDPPGFGPAGFRPSSMCLSVPAE